MVQGRQGKRFFPYSSGLRVEGEISELVDVPTGLGKPTDSVAIAKKEGT